MNKPQWANHRCNCLPHNMGVMNREVIHQDNGSHPQLWNQNLLDVEQEHIGIDAADHAQGGNQAIDTQAANQRNILPAMTRGCGVIQAFTDRSTTVQP